ncbi:hypothetical protein ACFYVL_09680 [Streptomyces sp. NPDC004111]|uniref:hypothetical protein n=1 Tax=Streptomyces sp. NPDC004111 TaxID=3364690 RepID=UPI0036893DE6
MSSNRNSDNPYPYEGGSYGDSSYGTPSYGDASYGDPSYGNPPHGAPSYPDASYGSTSYGDASYGNSSHGNSSYGADASHGQQQPHPEQRFPDAGGAGGAGQAAHDPYLTQSWQGQTWDTQYQPVQRPAAQAQPQHRPQNPAQPQPQPQFPQAAADTAYLPPQNGAAPSGSYPLPPEVPSPAPAEPEPVHGGAAPHPADAQPHHAAPQGRAPHDTESGPAYSSPATRGNVRITDAQRARAEGRSPIIDPGFQPALLTGVLGVLIAVAALFGQFAAVVPVVLLQAVTAAGWFRLNGMWPARQGIALAFLGGLVADVAILAVDTVHAPAAILGTLGVWVLLTVVLHLRNRMPADERMYALTAGVTSAALAVVASGFLAADGKAATVGGAAVAAATVARALPLPTPASLAVALLAATGAGIAAGGATGLGGGGAVIGLGAGVCALVGLRVAAYDYPSKFVHMTAGVALPLAAAAPVVYMLGRAFA